MNEEIRFETTLVKNEMSRKDEEALVVIRGDRRVAILPEPDRLNRALNQPLEMIDYITENLGDLLKREPTRDEQEFWKAVRDVKRSQEIKSES